VCCNRWTRTAAGCARLRCSLKSGFASSGTPSGCGGGCAARSAWPGLDVEVNSVGLWRINVTIADRLVQGRAVLCGDAAHQFPPTGGLGVNTGLQGMHNAMWKLALCVRGLAGWSLLKTYEDERREPAITTATQSLENHRNVARLAAAASTRRAVT